MKCERVREFESVVLLEDRGRDKTGNGADTLKTAVIVTVHYRYCK